MHKSFNVISLNVKVFLLYEDEKGLSLKTILVIVDGMADRPIKELGFKTPLEAAAKLNLDRIVKHGICGIMDPIAPGIAPGSDTSTLAILGYDPFKVYSGSGALEAEGSGIEVLPGNVAFRCNFATVNADLFVLGPQKLSARLFEEGVFALPIVFPMATRDKARIRTIMNAALTRKDLDFAINAFEKIGKELHII